MFGKKPENSRICEQTKEKGRSYEHPAFPEYLTVFTTLERQALNPDGP